MSPSTPAIPLSKIALALSWTLAAFGAWGWTMAAGVWTGSTSAASVGYLLLAALSLVVQLAANFAAAAARRARALRLAGSYRWSIGLMIAGGLFNAFCLHHAWEMTGLISAGLWALSVEALAASLPILLLSVVLTGFEPALYWIDEALRAETDALADAQFKARPTQHAWREYAAPAKAALASAAVAASTPKKPKPRGPQTSLRRSGEDIRRAVLALHQQGVTNRAEIARRTGAARSTVGYWIARASEPEPALAMAA